ncbi:TerC family protein [Candidatus Poribacteria bacterium]|nr:TerC family protein [Candidatus Poribacteria bacterium]
MADLLTVESLIAFLTLASLEIVLGIDNIVFITILVGKLPEAMRAKATRLGLGLAMISRIALLLCIAWIMKLTRPLFELFSHDFSGKDLILLGGGLFLIAKSTFEIHDKLEGHAPEHGPKKRASSFNSALLQIMLIDIVFSLDSVITAVGMADHVPIMIAAIVVAVLVMMAFASAVGRFVETHPTIKMLALSFLLLIGVMLVAEGLGKHIEKGYIYFAMGFSLAVEFLNMKMRGTGTPVRLHSADEVDRSAVS